VVKVNFAQAFAVWPCACRYTSTWIQGYKDTRIRGPAAMSTRICPHALVGWKEKFVNPISRCIEPIGQSFFEDQLQRTYT
jgi:hypothetical protein